MIFYCLIYHIIPDILKGGDIDVLYIRIMQLEQSFGNDNNHSIDVSVTVR